MLALQPARSQERARRRLPLSKRVADQAHRAETRCAIIRLETSHNSREVNRAV